MNGKDKPKWTRFPQQDRNNIPYQGDIAVAQFDGDGNLLNGVEKLSKYANYDYWERRRFTHWMSWTNYKLLIESAYNEKI